MLTKIRAVLPPLTAAALSAILLAFLSLGAGPLPPLGSALSPGAGVWNAASDGAPPHSKSVRLENLGATVTVVFDQHGVPSVQAGSDADLFRAQGYLHAAFRLTQLDLQRRMGSGRLAELNGPGSVESDKFQLQSGLLRTAEATWASTDRDSAAAKALLAYSQGVNARLDELRSSGDWPAVFTLTGVYPVDWTPVDSLVVQLLLTQNMGYSTAPLNHAVLNESLGPERTMEWFPVHAPDEQHPYDPGPYRDLGIDPMPASANSAAPAGDSRAASPARAGRSSARPESGHEAPAVAPGEEDTSAAAAAAADILRTLRDHPVGRAQASHNSNAWVANGQKVSGAEALLAGDPHLQLMLPSFWYRIGLSAPDTEVTGVSLTGLPGVLIGHNRHVSWSITNLQSQSTFYYTERTSPDRPGQYYWKGAWRPTEKVHYTIPVRGAASERLTVELTVHGPVMTQVGRTTSVYWTGNIPSPNIEAVLALNKAKGYEEFRSALAGWHAPALNFAYADAQGDIGMFAVGRLPVTDSPEPWLPMSGTGDDDIKGTIPYEAAPQAHNPPGGVLVSANQRPVSDAYPYYLGTTATFDNGFRASRLYKALDGDTSLTAADFRALQGDVTDELAGRVLPHVLRALEDAPLGTPEREALESLRTWDGRMTEDSSGAAVWWTFWSEYLSVVFQPWWDHAKVPVEKNEPGLKVSNTRAGLTQNLETWTIADRDNPAFTPPGAAPGDASKAMRTAYSRAIAGLAERLGPDPSSWNWGRLHTTELLALSEVPALGEPPSPAPGHRWTVNAALGEPSSAFGPSWRMVVNWTGQGRAEASGILAGGQSENPASPWYRDQIPLWRDNRLLPLRGADARDGSAVTWTLSPGE